MIPAEIKPRRVRFSWEDTPLHWVPGDPFTTHVINVLHLLLPAGERWFVHVYKQALPYITDDKLRAEAKGFMGQEGTHAVAHQRVLEHMKEQGLDPTPYVGHIEWMFERLLGDHTLPPSMADWWLRERLAFIAAIEHFTAVLGDWIVRRSSALDDAGADPVMLDLLRWHGAEEVEHRSVAYDIFMHVDGSHVRKIRTMALTVPMLAFLFDRGARYLVNHDPIVNGRMKARFSHFFYRSRQRRLPKIGELIKAVPTYMKREFHPSQEGDLQAALDYIAISPAHREFEHYAAARKGIKEVS